MTNKKKNAPVDEEAEARINAAMFFEAMKAQGKIETTSTKTKDLETLKREVMERARKKTGEK